MVEKWNKLALFRLLWPLIVEQLLAVIMGAADTVMVSPVGEFAVSGVNVIDNINNLFIIAFIALSTGGAVVCSQYFGRQDIKSANTAARQLIYVIALVSVVITILALAFRGPVIRIIYGRLEDTVMDAAMTYFFFTSLSYPVLALYTACAALFRSAGDSKTPMMIALWINVLHIALSALFLYVFNMGVAGVAFSTFLSRVLAAVISFRMLVKNKRTPISISGIMNVRFDGPMIRRVLNIGIPSGLENSMFQFGRLFTQRIFPLFGTSVIAANAVTSLINSVSFMPGNAFGIALLTVVGQCIGADDYEAAKIHTRRIMTITFITVFIINVFTFIFRGPLISIFYLGPEARSVAMYFLTIHCVSMGLGWTFAFALPNALRAAGDAKFVMIAAVISMWVVRVSAAYFFTFTLGIGPAGVWIAMGADFIVRGICYYTRWRRGRWQNIKVIEG